MSPHDPNTRRDDESADWPTTPAPRPPAGDDADPTVQLGHTPRPPAASGPQPRPADPYAPPPAAASPAAHHPPISPTPPPVIGPGWQQPGPGGWYPPPPGSGPPQRSNRRWWLLAGAVALAAVVIAAIVVTSAGDEATTPTATPGTTPATTRAATTPPRATTTVTAAPTQADIGPAALPQLLMSADEISTRMDTPGMVSGPVISSPSTDATITPANCAGAWAPADNATYAGSGFTALAGQVVQEQPKAYHKVIQAVVSFPDANAAKAFYDKQTADWNSCKFQHITTQFTGSSDTTGAKIGVSGETDGTLSLLILIDDIPGAPKMQCQRGLTARQNVIVDVRACSPSVGSAGWTLARDIGEKITGQR